MEAQWRASHSSGGSDIVGSVTDNSRRPDGQLTVVRDAPAANGRVVARDQAAKKSQAPQVVGAPAEFRTVGLEMGAIHRRGPL